MQWKAATFFVSFIRLSSQKFMATKSLRKVDSLSYIVRQASMAVDYEVIVEAICSVNLGEPEKEWIWHMASEKITSPKENIANIIWQ